MGTLEISRKITYPFTSWLKNSVSRNPSQKYVTKNMYLVCIRLFKVEPLVISKQPRCLLIIRYMSIYPSKGQKCKTDKKDVQFAIVSLKKCVTVSIKNTNRK